MMGVELLLIALGLLLFPVLARPLSRRLLPREWGRLSFASLATGVVALEGSFGLLALPTALRTFGAPGLASTCRHWLGELSPGWFSIGWFALLFAVAFPLALLVAWRRSAAASAVMHIESALGEHEIREGVDFVLLPTDAPIAYSVGFSIPQVVISRGLLTILTPDEVESVMRHELAHIRFHHPLMLVAVDVLDRVLPIVRWSTASIRTTMERWADEEACVGAAERATVRDALLRVAVTWTDEPAVAAFTSAATLVARLDALDAPVPSPGFGSRLAANIAFGVLVLAGVMALAGWVISADMVLAIAGICRM